MPMKSKLFERKTKRADGVPPTNQDTSDILEGSDAVYEIAEAHAEVDDNTGIERPKTVLPEKLAVNKCAACESGDCFAHSKEASTAKNKVAQRFSSPLDLTPEEIEYLRVVAESAYPDVMERVEEDPEGYENDPHWVFVSESGEWVINASEHPELGVMGTEDIIGYARVQPYASEEDLFKALESSKSRTVPSKKVLGGLRVAAPDTKTAGSTFRVQMYAQGAQVRSLTFKDPAKAEAYFNEQVSEFRGEKGVSFYLEEGASGEWVTLKTASKTASSIELTPEQDEYWQVVFAEAGNDNPERMGDNEWLAAQADAALIEAFPELAGYDHFLDPNSVSKTAAEMTTAKALKLAEDLQEDLQALYMKAKPLTQANESRPVREGVESIYAAMGRLAEAEKVLAKQVRQEEQEMQATEEAEKRKKKSSLGGLKLAEADYSHYDNDDFYKAYVEAAFWFTHVEDAPRGGENLDDNYGPEDLAPQTVAAMKKDCEEFQKQNAELLSQYYEALPPQAWSPEEQAGHDFWLSRNGHGAGFFDRDVLDEIKDPLQDAARAAGECDLYVGDDDLIYAAGHEGSLPEPTPEAPKTSSKLGGLRVACTSKSKACEEGKCKDCKDSKNTCGCECHTGKKAAKDPCWEGYERTPGTKPYSPGSCEKKAAAREVDDVYSSGATVSISDVPCDEYEGHLKPWGKCWNCGNDYSAHAEYAENEFDESGRMKEVEGGPAGSKGKSQGGKRTSDALCGMCDHSWDSHNQPPDFSCKECKKCTGWRDKKPKKASSKTNDRVQFAHLLKEHAPNAQTGALHKHVADTIAEEMMRLGHAYKKIQHLWVGDSMDPESTTKFRQQEQEIEDKIQALATQLGVTAIFSADPENSTIKLNCPDGFSNDAEKQGLVVPTA